MRAAQRISDIAPKRKARHAARGAKFADQAMLAAEPAPAGGEGRTAANTGVSRAALAERIRALQSPPHARQQPG
jgi:hypothetical protein